MTDEEGARLRAENERLQLQERRYREEAEAARYDAQILKWAVAGLAAANRLVRVEINAPIPREHLGDAVQQLGASAARRLIDEAGLAFRGHAMLAEALDHIRYLEGHWGGAAFRPWDEVKQRFGDRPKRLGWTPEGAT